MQFRGRYYFLSNFYPSPIEIDGLRYESAEAAFQGQNVHQPADGTYLCGLMHPQLSPSPDLSFVSLFSFPHHPSTPFTKGRVTQ